MVLSGDDPRGGLNAFPRKLGIDPKTPIWIRVFNLFRRLPNAVSGIGFGGHWQFCILKQSGQSSWLTSCALQDYKTSS